MSETQGCLIVSNESAISMPQKPATTNAYDVDFDQIKFFVNNHWLTPVKSCYKAELPNPVSLEDGDSLKIKIKIPVQVLGQKYGYELEGFDELKNKNNLSISLRLKSSDGCRDISVASGDIEITAYCGWFILSIRHIVSGAENVICNLCEIAYSICFDPLKLKTLYGVCDGDDTEQIALVSEYCLELTSASA